MKDETTYLKNHKFPTEYAKMLKLGEEAFKQESTQPVIARQKAEQASKIALKLNEYDYFSRLQCTIGRTLIFLGNIKEAIAVLENNLNFIREHLSDSIECLSLTYNILGTVYINTCEYQAALETLLIARSFAYLPHLGSIYNNLGLVYTYTGDNDKALECWELGLEVTDEIQDIKTYAQIRHNMSFAYFKLGRISETIQGIEKVLELFEKNKGKQQGVSGKTRIRSLNMLGEVYRAEKKYDAALEILEQALKLAEAEHFTPICCEVLIDKAKVYFEQAEGAAGIACLLDALAHANKSGLHIQKQETLEQIISYYKKTQNLEAAFPYLEQLYQIQRKQVEELRSKNFRKIILERDKEIHLLEEKNKEIQRQNATLKQFAYIISHDLREPIRGITGFASMLNNKYAQKLDATGNEYLQFILSEAHSMNRNLARLLQYTTIEKNTDNIKELDLQEIITKIQRQYQDESLQLNISFEGETIKMQRQHAVLLLSELIDNVIQFKKEGEDCQVEIKCELKEGYHHLSVKDYGIGIAPAYHDKIFKIFNKITKHEGNTGVGLAICERIVQLYKGEISVESTLNQFSTFHIKIPV